MSKDAKPPMNEITQGDWIEVANGLPDGCVHTIITSPPYFRQRDYGVAGQLGLEKDFQTHIDKLVVGFREMKRILRDDGIMWVNYADKYATMKGSCNNPGGGTESYQGNQKEAGAYPLNRGNKSDFLGTHIKQGDLIGLAWRLALALQADGWILRSDVIWAKAVSFNDKYSGSTMPESINGTRWERCRVKVKAQASGGRNIPLTPESWSKDNHPETRIQAQYKPCPGCSKCEANDGYVLRQGSWRPTRAHEYVFQFVKRIPYFADMEAVKEELSGELHGNSRASMHKTPTGAERTYWDGDTERKWGQESGRNIRDVWTINPQAYKAAHYATFPEKLVEPCIKVSTSQKGVCPKCGAQYARVIDSKRTFQSGSGKSGNMPDGKNGPKMQGGGETLDVRRGPCVETTTIGWRPTCSHCVICDELGLTKEQRKGVHDASQRPGSRKGVATRMEQKKVGKQRPASTQSKTTEEQIRNTMQTMPKDVYGPEGSNVLQPLLLDEMDVGEQSTKSVREKCDRPVHIQRQYAGASNNSRKNDRQGLERKRVCPSHQRGPGRQQTPKPKCADQNRTRTDTYDPTTYHELKPYPPVPAVVYDCFAGSGTVAAVAAKLNRNYMGSELSAEYMAQNKARIQEAETGIPAEEAKYQGSLFEAGT